MTDVFSKLQSSLSCQSITALHAAKSMSESGGDLVVVRRLTPGCQSQLLHNKSIIRFRNLGNGEWSYQGLDGVANLPHQAWSRRTHSEKFLERTENARSHLRARPTHDWLPLRDCLVVAEGTNHKFEKSSPGAAVRRERQLPNHGGLEKGSRGGPQSGAKLRGPPRVLKHP